MDELRDMIGREEENQVLHIKQSSRLIVMVDTLGLPTVFFTHSTADLQWPELACLTCPNDPDSS